MLALAAEPGLRAARARSEHTRYPVTHAHFGGEKKHLAALAIRKGGRSLGQPVRHHLKRENEFVVVEELLTPCLLFRAEPIAKADE